MHFRLFLVVTTPWACVIAESALPIVLDTTSAASSSSPVSLSSSSNSAPPLSSSLERKLTADASSPAANKLALVVPVNTTSSVTKGKLALRKRDNSTKTTPLPRATTAAAAPANASTPPPQSSSDDKISSSNNNNNDNDDSKNKASSSSIISEGLTSSSGGNDNNNGGGGGGGEGSGSKKGEVSSDRSSSSGIGRKSEGSGGGVPANAGSNSSKVEGTPLPSSLPVVLAAQDNNETMTADTRGGIESPNGGSLWWLVIAVLLFFVVWVSRDVLPRARCQWLWVVFDFVQSKLPNTTRLSDKEDDAQNVWKRISIRSGECGRCLWLFAIRAFPTARAIFHAGRARVISFFHRQPVEKDDDFRVPDKKHGEHRVLLADIEVDMMELPRLFSRESTLLTSSLLKPLMPFLPAKLHSRNLRLMYSTAQHGASISNLYYYMKQHRNATEDEDEREFPNLVILRDQGGTVFGAFSEYPWEPHRGYYGDGQTFLFVLYPAPAVYRWSGKNNFFINATAQSIGVGGGDKCAIWLDSGLRKGSSFPSQTFDCPQLASKKDFVCVELEAWRFVSTQE